MTIEEFNEARFGSGDLIIYKGEPKLLASVDFEEKLIAYVDHPDDEDRWWVRCENVQYIPYVPTT